VSQNRKRLKRKFSVRQDFQTRFEELAEKLDNLSK
jgi:hypothetical protein